MRYTFWQLKYLSPDDLQSRLVIADNANGCPDDIKRLQMRWRNGDNNRVALVPTFQERIGEFVPPWLLQAIESGNVQPVFVIDGDNPEVDVSVVASLLYHLTRPACLAHNVSSLHDSLFPFFPVPFGRSSGPILTEAKRVSTNRRVMLWHAGYAQDSRTLDEWRSLAEPLDLAWCHHLLQTVARVRLAWRLYRGGEEDDLLREKLTKVLMYTTVCPFAPMFNRKGLPRPQPLGAGSADDQMSGLELCADADGELEDGLIEILKSRGLPDDEQDAVEFVTRLAEIGREVGIASGELCEDTVELPRLSEVDPETDGTVEVPSQGADAPPGTDLLTAVYRDRSEPSAGFCMSGGGISSAINLTGDQVPEAMTHPSAMSFWNLTWGGHWWKNVPVPSEDFFGDSYYAHTFKAGSQVDIWPPFWLDPLAVPVSAPGMAGFSLHVSVPRKLSDAEIVVHVIPKLKTWKDTAALVPGVEEKDITQQFTPPPSTEEQTATELRKRWRKVKITVEVNAEGEFLEMRIDKGDGKGAIRVEAGEPNVPNCKLVTNEEELTVPAQLLLTVVASPRNSQKKAIKRQQGAGARKARERLRTGLKAYTGIGVIAEGGGKTSTPFGRGFPVKGDGGVLYHEIDFDLEVHRP